MAQLQQINTHYDPIQDRLILRLRSDDGSEFSLLLTRRYCRLLLQVFAKLTDNASPTGQETTLSQEARQALQQFQREIALTDSNTDIPYQEDAVSHPLGENPVLVTRIHHRETQNGQIHLTMASEEGQQVNINLDIPLIHNLCNIILLAASKGEWGLGEPTTILGEERPTSLKQPYH